MIVPKTPIDLVPIYQEAWGSHSAGCSFMCDCGRIFYDPEGPWDWEPGELEELERNPNATALGYGAGHFYVRGKEVSHDCDCWHEEVENLINGLEDNLEKIERYMAARKQAMEAYLESLSKPEFTAEGFQPFPLECRNCPHRGFQEGDRSEMPPGYGWDVCKKLKHPRVINREIATGKGRPEWCPVVEPDTTAKP